MRTLILIGPFGIIGSEVAAKTCAEEELSLKVIPAKPPTKKKTINKNRTNNNTFLIHELLSIKLYFQNNLHTKKASFFLPNPDKKKLPQTKHLF